MASWVHRMVGAAQLHAETYEEVEADKGANLQALGVVLLSSIAGGVSMIQRGGGAIAVGIATALIAWVLWAGITWLIGTKFLATPETRSNMGELLRTTGFAATPGIIRIFGGFPVIGFLFDVVAGLWMLAAFVVAVRQALDYRSTGRALIVCGIGWLVWFALIAWTFLLLGAGVAGFQAMRGNG